MSNYSQLLRDPRWQRKRLEILKRDNWACQGCGDTTNTLHVHHLRYLVGFSPWEYDGADLLTLCIDCHDERHELLIWLTERLALASQAELHKLADNWHPRFACRPD